MSKKLHTKIGEYYKFFMQLREWEAEEDNEQLFGPLDDEVALPKKIHKQIADLWVRGPRLLRRKIR